MSVRRYSDGTAAVVIDGARFVLPAAEWTRIQALPAADLLAALAAAAAAHRDKDTRGEPGASPRR